MKKVKERSVILAIEGYGTSNWRAWYQQLKGVVLVKRGVNLAKLLS